LRRRPEPESDPASANFVEETSGPTAGFCGYRPLN
jgi:hypothetical protein